MEVISYMERNAFFHMLQWKKDADRKPLILKGARQVGKTHVIRATLAAMNCNYIEINLIETPAAVKILQNFTSINELIMGLSTLTEKKFVKGADGYIYR